MKLIDLSKWNGEVNFNKVRSSGIDGVIIRTGYGQYYPTQIDHRFEQYYRNAKNAGLHIGAYHYSYAKDVSEVLGEAQAMLKIMKNKSFDLPVYGDFEEQGKLSPSLCSAMVRAFCDYLENNKAWAGIYSYDSFFKDKLPQHIGQRYTLWVARVENVKPKCVPEDEIGIWQNSWKGKIDGIKGDVDTDICYRNFPPLIKNSKRNKF
jgi:GH25 family lysozyme M1 (1,4-beta-N-acetylmuramidase)